MVSPAPTFRRILVPIGFGPASDDAIEAGHAIKVGPHDIEVSPAMRRSISVAASLATADDAELLLLHATPPIPMGSIYSGPVSVPADMIAEINTKSKNVSLEALGAMRDEYCEGLKVHLVARPGSPKAVIFGEAERFKADLIVMATSGRSRVERFFVGNTADRIIRRAPCPVLIIPASSE